MIDVSQLTEQERLLLLEALAFSWQRKRHDSVFVTVQMRLIDFQSEVTPEALGLPIIEAMIHQLGGDPELPLGSAAIQ